MQSEVYSQGINRAQPNKRLISVLKLLKRKKIKFYVVSHKTKFPYYGPKVNLHKISKDWLDNKIFNKKNRLDNCKYYFETTKGKKIKRIKKLRISHFVDDLKEIIDLIPNNVTKILYKKKKFRLSIIKNLINKGLEA